MFFELLIEILGPLLGTVVENAKFKTVLSGIYLHLCDQFKNPSLSMWVFKMHFYKYTFFGIIFVFFFGDLGILVIIAKHEKYMPCIYLQFSYQ